MTTGNKIETLSIAIIVWAGAPWFHASAEERDVAPMTAENHVISFAGSARGGSVLLYQIPRGINVV